MAKLHNIWLRNPSLVNEFISLQPDYKELCREVSYILKQRLKANDIKVSSITYRVKTLNSFLEKLSRKAYSDPLKEITDLAGVRVVSLYRDDINYIEKIIEDNFYVLEKVDKFREKSVDEFGYGAIHYIVRLNPNISTIICQALRDLPCEIQIRTILQDAWALVAHHIVYKKEESIPNHLKRKLNSLAALFERADEDFQHIRNERDKYIKEIKYSPNKHYEFVNSEINLDTFNEFLKWKYPDKPAEAFIGQLDQILYILKRAGFQYIKELDMPVDSTLTMKVNNVLQELDLKGALDKKDGIIPSATYHLILLLFRKPSLIELLELNGDQGEILKKFLESPTNGCT